MLTGLRRIVTMTGREHDEIYKSLSGCLRSPCGQEAGRSGHLLSGQVLQLELSADANRIISPPLRPASGYFDFLHAPDAEGVTRSVTRQSNQKRRLNWIDLLARWLHLTCGSSMTRPRMDH